MSLQIESHHLQIILKILGPYAPKTSVFGSRAKGTARPLSDLDLILQTSVARDELARLRRAFEESNLPYKVDLILINDLDPSFLTSIQKDFCPIMDSPLSP